MDLTIKIAAQSSKGYKNYTHIMKECTLRKKSLLIWSKKPKRMVLHYSIHKTAAKGIL